MNPEPTPEDIQAWKEHDEDIAWLRRIQEEADAYRPTAREFATDERWFESSD